jgi:hypothetical protein
MGTYTSPAEVADYSGVQPEWLDKTPEELSATLERWISAAEELVNRYCEKQWTAASVPQGVKDATERIVANKIAQARLNRRAGVIRTDQYGQREETPMPSTRVFTQAIKDDLDLYRRQAEVYQSGANTTIQLLGGLGRTESSIPDTFGDWEDMRGQYPWVSEEQQP